MRLCEHLWSVWGSVFRDGKCRVAVASRGRGQGWGGRATGPRAGGPLGACRNPLGQHGALSANCPEALGAWGPGFGQEAEQRRPWGTRSGGQSGSSWSGKDSGAECPVAGPPPWCCSRGPGATPSHMTPRGCAHRFIANRDTSWETVYPAAGLSRKLIPTSIIFLIYEETKPELFLLYCKQIQVSCLDILQKSPIIINIMKVYFSEIKGKNSSIQNKFYRNLRFGLIHRLIFQSRLINYQLNITVQRLIILNTPIIFNNLKINSSIYDDNTHRYHVLNIFLKILFITLHNE